VGGLDWAIARSVCACANVRITCVHMCVRACGCAPVRACVRACLHVCTRPWASLCSSNIAWPSLFQPPRKLQGMVGTSATAISTTHHKCNKWRIRRLMQKTHANNDQFDAWKWIRRVIQQVQKIMKSTPDTPQVQTIINPMFDATNNMQHTYEFDARYNKNRIHEFAAWYT
jgi:hypothetical protein